MRRSTAPSRKLGLLGSTLTCTEDGGRTGWAVLVGQGDVPYVIDVTFSIRGMTACNGKQADKIAAVTGSVTTITF